MGSLTRFNLNRIIREYNSKYLFETGTLWGDGVAYGLRSPFKKIISVEIIPEIAAKARQRFEGEEKVEILEGDSLAVLQTQLPAINENIIFWLDAHFPGADAGLNNYDHDHAEHHRLPLVRELEIIKNMRKDFEDVLILDDMRIYEEGPYQNGNAPADVLPKGKRNLDFVHEYFSNTHLFMKSYLDEGYILLFPKKRYKKNHSRLMDIFKKDRTEDHYLAE